MIFRMRDPSVPTSAKGFVLVGPALALALALVALGGCKTVPVQLQVPPPPLRLLESKPLVLGDDCAASGSFFVEFTVLSDGRTDRVQAPSGPPCVQQALTAWVSSFRYAPPAAETVSGVEWMAVTARRGS